MSFYSKKFAASVFTKHELHIGICQKWKYMSVEGSETMRILSIGTCNVAHVYNVNHIVREGETIFTDCSNDFPSGKGLTQSVALARAGGLRFFMLVI